MVHLEGTTVEIKFVLATHFLIPLFNNNQKKAEEKQGIFQFFIRWFLTLSWNCQFLVETYLNRPLYISEYNNFVKDICKNNTNKYIYLSKT